MTRGALFLLLVGAELSCSRRAEAKPYPTALYLELRSVADAAEAPFLPEGTLRIDRCSEPGTFSLIFSVIDGYGMHVDRCVEGP